MTTITSGGYILSDAPHTVEALCPLCRIRVEVPITLQTLLKKTVDKTIIHITLLQETTLHRCGQQRIDDAIDAADDADGDQLRLPSEIDVVFVDHATGEILDGADR